MNNASYGWMIDTDHMPGKDAPPGTNANARGVMGPSNIGPEVIKRLHRGEGRTFRMYDDDRELYYTGRIITRPEDEGSARDFAPLDDFGKPNAGATEIHYQRDNGTWYEL